MWGSLRQDDAPSPGLTPELLEAFKKQNALQRTITYNRVEYLEACAATRKLFLRSLPEKMGRFPG